MSKVSEFMKHPSKMVLFLQDRVPFKVLPDKYYIMIKYRLAFGKLLDLKNPQTYNEKLQWLKLYNRKPEYSIMVDKYEVKKYVADRIGEEYIIPTLGVWDSFDEIDFDSLPNRFVMKCTHDSGGVVICKDKSTLDIAAVRRKINHSLRVNYYLKSREWPYKNVKPRIIAEEYLEDDSGCELKDYKWYCFNGTPKVLGVIMDRFDPNKEITLDCFDMDFRHLPIKYGHPNSDQVICRPEGFEQMRYLAEVLSQGLPAARIDFYNTNGKVYFGEITFFPTAGFIPLEPAEWDNIFGDWIRLPEKKSFSTESK